MEKRIAKICSMTVPSVNKGPQAHKSVMQNRVFPCSLMVCLAFIINACSTQGHMEEQSTKAFAEVKAYPVDLADFTQKEDLAAVFLGADGMELNYADEDMAVFHTYAGLFVCEKENGSWSITHTLDFEPLGANMTQGDEASLIYASEKEAWVMPRRYKQDSSDQVSYCYSYADEALRAEDGFKEIDDSALKWSYSEEGMAVLSQLSVRLEDLFLSNLYPIDGTDSGQYGFMSAGSEGIDTLTYGIYDKKSDRIYFNNIALD